MPLLEQLTIAVGDRYRVERELGQGGMAVVFLAEDLKHHRRVALKVLKPELSAVLGSERFLREIEIAAAFLSGSPRQNRLGVGGSMLAALRDTPAADTASLTLADVDAVFERAAAASGAGSTAARADVLRELLRRADPEEQELIVRLIVGELRQGALEGVLLEAVARASRLPPAPPRSAAACGSSRAASDRGRRFSSPSTPARSDR